MAPSLGVGALYGIGAIVAAFVVVHLVYFPKLYYDAIADERADIGPPWTTAVTAVNLILACTVRDLQNEAALWGNNWQLIQKQVRSHARDQNLIDDVRSAYRLTETLGKLDRWSGVGRTYSIVAAVFTVVCPVACFYFGMKGQSLLWLPVFGAAIITFSLHGIFIQVIHRRGREAKDIHETLREAFE